MNKTFYKTILVCLILLGACSNTKRLGSGFDFVELNLENLSVLANGSNLVNNFDSATKAYNIEISSAISSLNINATANKIDAEILVTSNRSTKTCTATKTLNTCVMPIEFNSNKINIKLTQKDKITTYIININRSFPSSLASNIALNGVAQANYNLNFNSLTFSYNVVLNPNENDIYLVAVPEDASSTLRVNNVVKTCSVNSPCQIPMFDVSTTINIKITTYKGNSSTYILTINKDLSAYLEDVKLLVNSQNILNNFAYYNTNYYSINMSPLYNQIIVSIDAKPNTQIQINKNGSFCTNQGTVSGNYVNYNVSVTETYITLEIISTSSTFNVHYFFYINREANINLSNVQYQLNQSGSFINFDFNSANNEYSKSFINGVISNSTFPIKITSIFNNAYIAIKEHQSTFYTNFGYSPYTININVSNILTNGGDLNYDILVKPTQNSSYEITYVLKITIFPPSQVSNPVLQNMVIKNSSNNIVPTQPAFHYNTKIYYIIADPRYRNFKISATSLSSTDAVNVYVNNSLQACTSTLGVLNNCNLTNIVNEDIVEVKVSNSQKTTIYKVNVNNYLIFENTNPDMNANNPDLHDAFGAFMASKEVQVGSIKYNYLLVGNPLKNKVYVYRASVNSNGSYTNFALLKTLVPEDVDNLTVAHPNITFTISRFGETLAINNNFIVIGAPNTGISGYSNNLSNAGVLISYKINQSTGSISAHQAIVPSDDGDPNAPYRGITLNANDKFGTKIAINSDNKIIAGGRLSFNKNLYIFSNENNTSTNNWILSTLPTYIPSLEAKKLQIIYTNAPNYSILTNLAISQNYVSACYHTTQTISDNCLVSKYSNLNNEYSQETAYSQNGLEGTGVSMSILETNDFTAVLIGEPYYDNLRGRLITLTYFQDTWYSFDIDEGDSDNVLMANSFSVISKTVNNNLKHFILVSSPNTGSIDEQGQFSIYQIYKQNNDIEFFEYFEDVSANELFDYFDDRLTNNATATNNFIIMNAPMYDNGTNINSNEGAMFIFKTDLYISDNIYNYVTNNIENSNIE